MKRYEVTSAASDNADTVQASAANVKRIVARSTISASRHLQLYNKATDPTPGTDKPTLDIEIPGYATIIAEFNQLKMSAGLAVSATVSLAGTSPTEAGDLVVDIQYN